MRGTSYVPTRDGTRLAVFVHRPEDRVRCPVLLMCNRYNRTSPNRGHLAAWLGRWSFLSRIGVVGDAQTSGPDPKRSIDEVPWLARLVAAGYAIAIVDGRGTGSSFGWSRGPFDRVEADDVHDVGEWLASQPWCNGRVGMFGRSYMGTNQLLAADRAPPSLRAIFPQMPLFDLYDFIRGGGVFREGFARHWTADVERRDLEVPGMRLDEDPQGVLLRQALVERARSRDVFGAFSRLSARDDRDPETDRPLFLDHSPASIALAHGPLSLPCQLLAGWYDCFLRDAVSWWHNLAGPRRLIIGPWAHEGSLGYDLTEEHALWYGHWLEDRDTGVLAEPAVSYYTIGAPPGQRWRSAERWPPPGFEHRPFYLHDGPCGSVRSRNDGGLGSTPPTAEAVDEYRVDARTSSGSATRWTHGYGGPFGYEDLRPNDERCLTYTTPPLEHDLDVTGHPVVHVWLDAEVADVQLFAFLEQVSPDGESEYVTEGALALAHRALHRPSWNDGGLPWHRGHREDLQPVPDQPVELVLDLLPLSRRFVRGHRIRLALCCADRDNAQIPPATVGTRVRVHRSPARPSRLLLPLAAGVGPR